MFGRPFARPRAGGSRHNELDKREAIVHLLGPARRNARTPGEDLGGVKTQQKGEEQEGAEQRRGGDHRTLPSDLTRSLPPSPGGGRIDHPQGGNTARPPCSAVPQRAVDIIWRCAGGDQHNAVCWVCAGFVLGLCQVCAGVVLGLCWVCAGVVLGLCSSQPLK